MNDPLLQLFKSGKDADFTFVIESDIEDEPNVEILVHSQILGARSIVFSTMFRKIWAGTDPGNKRIIIKDVDPNVFRTFLCYVYGGKNANMTPPLEIRKDEDLKTHWWFNLLALADRYDIKQLAQLCEDKLIDCIGTNSLYINFIEEMFALDHICPKLLEFSKARFCDDIMDPEKKGRFEDVDAELIKKLLID